MRKKWKRLLALILAFVMLFGAIPAYGPAQVQAAKKVNVKKVTLNYNQYVLKKGKKLKLKATITPKKAKTKLKWKTSNKKIASVNSKGVVTAKGKKGKATITVTAGKKKAKCRITIGTAVKKITASDLKLKKGETAKIQTAITPANATIKKLSYTSSDTTIAKVDNTGKVTALKAGKAQITILAEDCGKVKKVIAVEVTEPQSKPETKPTEKETEKETETEKPIEGEYKITLYNGETKLKELVKPAGTKLKELNAPYLDEKIFLGWYYDAEFTKKVETNDVLKADISLYAKYGEGTPLNEDGSPNYLAEQNVESDFAVVVDAHTKDVSVDDVKAALVLKNISDPNRTDDKEYFEKDELQVTALGNGKFTVKAKDGYQAGDTYQIEITESEEIEELTFEDQESEVIYYNFTIKKDEILNLSLDGGMKYLSVSELSKEDAEKILKYEGLYQAKVDEETGETTYVPTNAFGTFTYTEGAYIAGDIVAVYEGVKPDERDLDTELGDGVSYIEITKAEGTTYSYKSADAKNVLFIPDVIPIDVDEGDGVTGWTAQGNRFTIKTALLDFTTGYEEMGLDFSTVVEAGDFVAFYEGEYGSEEAVDNGYGRIVEITESGEDTVISYEPATYEEVRSSMDIYKESELTQEQLDSIDEEAIESMAEKQALESGFAQEAGVYLAALAVETDEVKDMMNESELQFKDCEITYEDGTEIAAEDLVDVQNGLARAGGTPEVKASVSKNLVHFEEGSGFRVELALKYSFDLKKNGGKQKIAINLTAIFETEVLLSFSASGGVEIRFKWIFPYIYDYKMVGNIDQGLYTGIAVTATAKLEEEETPFGPEMLEPDGLDDYAQKILDLSESIKEMMEASKSDESEGTASGGLIEKYESFIEDASDSWVELVSVPIFTTSGSLDPFYVTAYSVDIDFVVSANMSVAIGMSFQYEKAQRHSFTLCLLHRNDTSSNTVDLTPERYQFDFYVMGMLGIRAGVRAKVLFGLFSTDLAGIGIQLEAGAYARLWGYFYYCLSWQQGKGKESSATGAMLIEIGAYLDLALAMEVLNGTFSYNPTLYSKEWPLWNVGERENVLDFAYDEDGEWVEVHNGKSQTYQVPLSFTMIRSKSLQLPAEIFRMNYMDLKEGGEGYLTYDDEKRASYDPSSSAYDDEERFFIELSEPAFKYNPINNTISIDPADGKYSYEGTMTVTWKKPHLTYASKTLSKTFELYWADPDKGKCLNFDTKGGTMINTKVYEPGAAILEKDIPKDPTKLGYEFGGWCSDEACTTPTDIPKVMPQEDTTLYAKWIPLPNEYRVRHHYEELNTSYTLEKTTLQTENVYSGDFLSQSKIIEANRNDKHGFEVDTKKTTKSATVAADGSLIVDIYYKRQIHSVTYTFGEMKDAENTDITFRYRYGESIYEPYYYVRGYKFDGWDQDVVSTMDVSDLKYNAVWTPNTNTPYYIEYYIKVPGSKDKYVMLGGDNGRRYEEGKTNADVLLSEYALDDNGYRFIKAEINGVEAELDASGKINPEGTLTIKYYYEGIEYDLIYDEGFGRITTDLEEVPKTYTHGIPQSIDHVVAEREGYNFIGWLEGDKSIREIPSYRVGTITLTAEWRPVTCHIQLYDSDGKTSLGTIKARYEEVMPSLTKIPTKEGYDFAGFYTDEGVEYYNAEGRGQFLWEEVRDITLKASWTPKKLQVSFDGNGAEEELLAVEETYLSNYKDLPTAVKTGYHMLGWILEGDDAGNHITEDTQVRISEDHTLVAQWAPNTDTSYTVEYYMETEEYSEEYNLLHSVSKTGTTGKKVQADTREYSVAGYTFDPANENNVLSAAIEPDGSTVLKLYYKRGKHYSVTLDYGEGMPTEQYLTDGDREIRLSADHTKENMDLIGWTDGKVFYEKDSYYQMDYQDVVFTAVWETKEKMFSVSYRFNSPNDGERFKNQTLYNKPDAKLWNNIFSVTPIYEEGTEKILKYYEFTGWNTEEDGSGTQHQPGELVSDVTTNTTDTLYLYAQWEEKELPEDMVPYYVVYRIQDESGMYRAEDIQMMFGKEGELTNVTAYEFDYLTAAEFKQKTIKIGEGADNKGADNERTYTEYEGYTVVELVYTRDSYKLTLDYNGGVMDEETQYVMTVPYKGYIFFWGQPTKEDYTFVGWDGYLPSTMPAHDITLKAQYRENASRMVTVNYYLENLEGTDYTLEDKEIVYGKMNTDIIPKPKELDGFLTPDAKTVKVLEDGSAVCDYYYDRMEFTLSWNAGDGTLEGEDYSKGTIKYGAEIKAPSLTRTGYTGEWKDFTGIMPAKNITYQSVWTPQKVQYHVMYRKMEENGAYTTLYSLSKTAFTGEEVQEECNLKEEYAEEVAVGYIQPLTQRETINGDGTTIIYMDYNRYKRHITYDFSGAEISESYPAAGDYYYGKTLQLPRVEAISKNGCRILGWYDIRDTKKTVITDKFIQIGTEDVTYKIKWEPIIYTIDYDLNSEEAENLSNPDTYQTGFDFNISSPQCKGMIFTGWEWTGEGEMPEGVALLENGLVHITEKATGNLSFRATWRQDVEMKEFRAFMYTGSGSDFYEYTYPASEDLTLEEIPRPVREGFLFAYWTKVVASTNYGNYSVVLSGTTKASTLNINKDFVTANWIKVSEMEDGYLKLHVTDQQELKVAAEYLKENAKYRSIVLENDIEVDGLTEVYLEIFEDGYLFDGQGHTLKLKNAATSLFGENKGTIQNLTIAGGIKHTADKTETETYFGAFAKKNYGTISKCAIKESTNEDSEKVKSYIQSDAKYFGGFVGYNEGVIKDCTIKEVNIWWDETVTGENSVYLGGFAGHNAFDGEILNSAESQSMVTGKKNRRENPDLNVYYGGAAGINQGKISKVTIDGSVIGNVPYEGEKSILCAGGFAGIDGLSGTETPVRGIYECTIKDTKVLASAVGGGLIGECNYGVLENNLIQNVEIEGKKQYAGVIAGIYRTPEKSNGKNKIDGAAAYSDTTDVGVVGGLCENVNYALGTRQFVIELKAGGCSLKKRGFKTYKSYGKGEMRMYFSLLGESVVLKYYPASKY